MLDKDFYWCYNHENLFRRWVERFYDIDGLYADKGFDSDSIFSLWQTAKKYALEIANSEEPGLLYRIKRKDIKTKMPDNFCYIMQFLNTMLMSSKNKNLESFANFGNEMFKSYLSENKIDENSIDELDMNSLDELNVAKLTYGQIESDYDYSLPDGGLTKTITKTKTEMETDETKTITDETITITDETQAETEEERVDVILQNYNSFNNVDFISAMQKAIGKGWIKIKDGKCEWIGPKIYKGNSDSALVYFIGKALNLKTDVERVKDPATGIMKDQLTDDSRQDAINRFPKEEIKSLFGKSLIISQWKQIFKVNKKQVWREVIDKFFDENKENKENIIQ